MKSDKSDRRSQRTRAMLGEALVDLMLEKSFDGITVQDILDRANVGRSTFYAHYTDKHDLMFSELGRVLHDLTQGDLADGEVDPVAAPADKLLLPSLQFFRHVRQNQRLLKALIWGRGFEDLKRQLEAAFSRTVEANLKAQLQPGQVLQMPAVVLANFVAGSFVNLLRWWIESDMSYSPEAVDEMFRKMVMPGVNGVMGWAESA